MVIAWTINTGVVIETGLTGIWTNGVGYCGGEWGFLTLNFRCFSKDSIAQLVFVSRQNYIPYPCLLKLSKYSWTLYVVCDSQLFRLSIVVLFAILRFKITFVVHLYRVDFYIPSKQFGWNVKLNFKLYQRSNTIFLNKFCWILIYLFFLL